MSKSPLQRALEDLWGRHKADLHKIGEDYRQNTLLPICRQYGITYSPPVDSDPFCFSHDSMEFTTLEEAERHGFFLNVVWRDLNIVTFGGMPFAHYVPSVTDRDIGNLPSLAREFAIKAHGDQLYGKEHPYSVHLDEVAEIVRTVTDVPEAIVVAYLHDVLEDTDTPADEILTEFGPFVLGQVMALTDPEGPNRKERKRILHERISTFDESYRVALMVKAADRLANIRQCHKTRHPLMDMYRKEHEAFHKAAFRQGLCDPLWEEMVRLFNLRSAS